MRLGIPPREQVLQRARRELDEQDGRGPPVQGRELDDLLAFVPEALVGRGVEGPLRDDEEAHGPRPQEDRRHGGDDVRGGPLAGAVEDD